MIGLAFTEVRELVARLREFTAIDARSHRPGLMDSPGVPRRRAILTHRS